MRNSFPSTPGRPRRLTGTLTAVAVAAAGCGLLGSAIEAPVAGAATTRTAPARAVRAIANPMVTLLQRGISKPAGMVVVNGSGITTDIVDSGHNRVISTSFPASANVFAVVPFTGLLAPTGIAANGSTLYVADTGNNRVVELNGTTQTTLPFAGLQAPAGVAVDAAGDVWVADTGHNRILGLPAGAGSQVVEPFAGLSSPGALVADNAGDLFAADTGNNRVLELAAGASAPTTLAMPGTTSPRALALGEGNRLLVATSTSAVTYSIDSGITLPSQIFTGLSGPEGIAAYPSFTGDPFVAVADTGHNRVVEFGGQESVPTTIVPPVLPQGVRHEAIAADAAGDVVYTVGSHVWEMKAGTTTPVLLPFTTHGLYGAVAIDRRGDVFVLVSTTVMELAAGGTIPFTVGPSTTYGCLGLGVDAAGDVFLGCDLIPFGSGTVSGAVELAKGSSTWKTLFTVPNLAGIAVRGLAVDGAGDVWVTDAADNALYGQRAGTSTVLRIAAPNVQPQQSLIAGAAFDPYGTLYFADNFTVYGVIPGTTTVYQTVLGLNPTSLAVAVAADAQGNVYLDDIDGAGNIIVKELPHLHPPAILPVNVSIAVRSVASDAAGNLYYTSQNQGAFALPVRAATPTALPDPNPGAPLGAAVDRTGDVFLSEEGGSLVEEITKAKQVLTFAAPGGGGVASRLGVDAAANLYASEGLQVFELAKGAAGWKPVLTSATAILDMSVDSAGDIVVLESGGSVAELKSGTTTPMVLPFTAVTAPTAVAIDGRGDVFAADTQVGQGGASSGAHIYELGAGATVAMPLVTDGFPPVNGMAVDGSGHVFVACLGGMFEAHANQ
jgi:streptogramin lyase